MRENANDYSKSFKTEDILSSDDILRWIIPKATLQTQLIRRMLSVVGEKKIIILYITALEKNNLRFVDPFV